jgi:uncharacterized protein GlcG (DUF336 family)
MDQTKSNPQIEDFIAAVERLLPEFLADPIDMLITGGNVSVMVIEENGRFYGRMFGSDRLKQRGTSHTAWQKSTQVLITNIATRRFEELVYSKQLDPSPFGLMDPDFVGWPGGLPATLADGTKLALAVSGMRGFNDAEILRRAAAQVPGMKIVDTKP